MIRKISADYILPIADAPIKEGVVVFDEQGKILEVGLRKDYDPATYEKLKGIIVPGFINTHCHLELSHMKGMLKERTGLISFIKGVLSKREAPANVIREAIEAAEEEMLQNGIVAVGDISNVPDTFAQKYKNNLRYHTFVEVFNLDPAAAQDHFKAGMELFEELSSHHQSASIVPHAPYTVSLELFEMIRQFNNRNDFPSSMHNQETKDENLFFLTKEGGFTEFYEEWGFEISYFTPTGKKALESVLPGLPRKGNMLLVHNTMTQRDDIQKAMAHNAEFFWCFNPNANLYIEGQLPNYRWFLEEGVKCTLGTDSLASNWHLSVLEEMKIIEKHAPYIKFDTLIEWATINGATALGFENDLGSIEIGKSPGINLIQGIDMDSWKLTDNATVIRLDI